MAFPDINIGSKFDAKGFKQAQSATEKLGKSVKNLAATFGVAFSVAAIVAYGKAAAKAASDDSKAQAILANNLKNVGLAYAQMPVEQFINNMQKQTGILDDQLRPAFSRLAQVTGSVQKSQELMASAFDISSGSGVDFATVVETLSQAYVGNTKGVKKLQINMTAAELKTASFNDIITQLNNQFSGAGKAAVATYGGQMQLLTAAASDAQEVIGVALLDALKNVSGSDGVEGLTTGIGHLAEATALFIELLAKPLNDKGSWVNKLYDLIQELPGFNQSVQALASYLDVQDIRTGYGQQSPGERAKAVAAELAAAKRNKAVTAELRKQAAAAAALAKAKKEQAALDKATAAAQLALGRGADVFDMEKIQLNAALIGQAEALGKATTGAQVLAIANDVQRLKVKQDMLALEDAIASKDVARINAATKQLNEDLKILGTLQSQNFTLLGIKTVLDTITPKELIDQNNLNSALLKIREMLALLAKVPTNLVGTATGGSVGPGISFNPNQNKDRNYDNNFLGIGGDMPASLNVPGIDFNPSQNKDRNYTNNVINVTAGVIGDENIIVDAVQNALNEIARRGYLTTYAGAIAV